MTEGFNQFAWGIRWRRHSTDFTELLGGPDQRRPDVPGASGKAPTEKIARDIFEKLQTRCALGPRHFLQIVLWDDMTASTGANGKTCLWEVTDAFCPWPALSCFNALGVMEEFIGASPAMPTGGARLSVTRFCIPPNHSWTHAFVYRHTHKKMGLLGYLYLNLWPFWWYPVFGQTCINQDN